MLEQLTELFKALGDKSEVFSYVVMALFSIAFILYILEKFGILSPVTKQLGILITLTKKQLTILEKGYLHKYQVDIVKDFASGRNKNLKQSIIKIIMDTNFSYKSGEIDEELVLESIQEEFEAAIADCEKELYVLPNIKENSLSPQEKMDKIMKKSESILSIIKTEDEKSAAKRVKGVVDTIMRDGEI